MNKTYDYTFRVFPEVHHDCTNSIKLCFEFYGFLTMTFTESEFETFRSELWLDSLDVHEITRRLTMPDEVVV